MSRNMELYGRHRIPRSHRRVMLVMLTWAGNVNGYVAMRAARVGSGSFYIAIGRLEKLGYVERQARDAGYADGNRRFRYVLTSLGREALLELLGLTEYDPDDKRWYPEPMETPDGN